MDNLMKVFDRINGDVFDHGRFRGVLLWNNQPFKRAGDQRKGDGQRSFDWFNVAVKRQLSQNDILLQSFARNLFAGRKDTQRDGKVKGRAFFFCIGWGEVDRDPFGAELIAAVFDGGADALPAFLDGIVGQTDKDGRGQAAARIDFNGNGIRL